VRWPRHDREEWHRWFAWHPVTVGKEWVWWEHVERRATGVFLGSRDLYKNC